MSELRQQKIAGYYLNKIHGVELLIDNVVDPHNVAAVSRSADALGITTINLYYTYNEFPRMQRVGKKSSSSANKWMRFNRVTELANFVQEKKQAGYVFIGSALSPEAEKLTEISFPDKLVLVLGAESKGMSPEVISICDRLIYIPMVGMVQSFNVSVAAGIILYELFKQKGTNLKLRPLLNNTRT